MSNPVTDPSDAARVNPYDQQREAERIEREQAEQAEREAKTSGLANDPPQE